MTLTIVITSIIACVLTFSILFFVILLSKNRIERQIRLFITQPDEKTPSPLAVFVDNVAFIFATRLVNNLKTTVMGMQSVDSKNEKKAVIEGLMNQSPVLANILALIPGARRLVKSPAILSMVAKVLTNMKGGDGSISPESPPVSTSPFKM